MYEDIRITTDDVKAGRVLNKIIENDVVVLPCLQINNHTLREHQDFLRMTKYPPLSEVEIAKLYPDSVNPPVEEEQRRHEPRRTKYHGML